MTQVLKILIVDDDPDLRGALAEQLALHEEFMAVETGTARGALDVARPVAAAPPPAALRGAVPACGSKAPAHHPPAEPSPSTRPLFSTAARV